MWTMDRRRKWDGDDDDSEDEEEKGRICCCCCGTKTGSTLIAVLQIVAYGSCLVVSLAVGIHLMSVTLLLRFVDDTNRKRVETLVAHPHYDDVNYAEKILLDFGVAQITPFVTAKIILWTAIFLFSLQIFSGVTLLVGVLKRSAVLLLVWISTQIFGLVVFLVAQIVCHFVLPPNNNLTLHSHKEKEDHEVVRGDEDGHGHDPPTTTSFHPPVSPPVSANGSGTGLDPFPTGWQQQETVPDSATTDPENPDLSGLHNVEIKVTAVLVTIYFILVVYVHYRKLRNAPAASAGSGAGRRAK